MPKQKAITIGIDARFYGSIGKGLGRYAQELVDRLVATDQVNNFVVFLGKENFNEFQTSNPRVRKVLADIRWYSWQEQIIMPFIIRRAKVDFMHYLHFNVPLLAPRPFIVTIHDLILYRYPTLRSTTLNPLYYWLKNLAYRIIINFAVHCSRQIITVSQFTKQDILEQFKIKEGKVIVTYEGVSAFADQADSTAVFATVLKRYKLAQPFLLYVGSAYPHKNLNWLVEAVEQLPEKSLSLVFVGKEDYFSRQLQDYIKSQPRKHRYIFPGFVPDSDLLNLYRQAEAYVFPSLYEGFGLPPLEAMAAGCPVLAARASSLPEVLGEAALYFDPSDLASFGLAWQELQTGKAKRAQLIKAGLARAASFSWQRCMEQTLAIYSKLCSKTSLHN
jgi:glycosyltransferase involved in cell wall biosynthesis